MSCRGAVDLSYPNSKTRRGRVQEGGMICPTITAQNTGICIIEPQEKQFEEVMPLDNKDEFEKIIYVSHPFQDKLSNLREIENIILSLKKQYPNYLFISPSHTFSFEYTYTDFDTSMHYCYWLLRKCDECWVFGDWENSNGCKAEIKYCRTHDIPLCVRTGYPKIAKEESSSEIV